MKRTRVLVTGGAGYIGSHTAKLLAQSGFEPIVFDNLCRGHEWAIKSGPFVHGDLANPAQVRTVLLQYKVEAVIHFAAHAYVGESMFAPAEYFRNNVGGTLNLLDAQVQTGVKYIVFSSTCATYGRPRSIPIQETQPQEPINPCGESKLFVERVLHWYEHAYGLRWIALRYFNAAGADLDGELGEEHNPETHLIPIAIQTAMGFRHAAEIYGTDYATPDGSAIRDYIHVHDLARAHILALQHLLNKGNSTALNLGTGHGHSVRQILAAVEEISGCPVRIHECARRFGDPAELVADARKAAEVLGWHTHFSELPIIIQTAWNWHRGRARAAKVAFLSGECDGNF